MQPLASHLAFHRPHLPSYKMEVVSTTHVHWRQCFTSTMVPGPTALASPGNLLEMQIQINWFWNSEAGAQQVCLAFKWFCCSGLKPLRYGLCVLLHAECHRVLCTKNLINFKNKCLHQHTSHLLPLLFPPEMLPTFSKPSHSLRIQLKSHLPVKFFPDHNISPLPTSSFLLSRPVLPHTVAKSHHRAIEHLKYS